MTAPAGVARRVGVRLWTLVLWLTVAGCAVWALVRGIGFDTRTPFAQLVSFTPYVAAFSLVPVVAAGVTRRWRVLVAALAVAALFGAFVVPRVLPSGSPSGGTRLRVMAFNTKIGAGSVSSLAALVRRASPDVLTVQELTPEWAAEFSALGLFPYSALRALPGASGTGIWAKYPLTDARTVDSRTGFDQTRATLRGPRVIDVISAHPRPPIFKPEEFGSVSRWTEDLSRLPGASTSGAVRVMAGDFNASLDHSPFRKLVDTGYVDAAAEVGKGLVPTWPMNGNKAPPVTLDHVLVDSRGDASSFNAYTIPGSDHRAIVADLIIRSE
ncbi:endonuclease/exonuclease/phosphatase family protein [Cryptosporangium phraense]|uniref:Endonuclease/exonuclease/phosphatase family protein n=1 Tax=Cryptosporangium phraense TaxID=2593070 RepID=A0A545AUL5_9ACTN|nr:endonuclease/exonuclease/phosphatase family protein [Cryptosporangium phraense]TQS44961.1 endonuclease/exonuclease/phosphatase family protein [Cryptosporangium phraense]